MQTIHKRTDYTFDIPDVGTVLDIDTLQDIVRRSGSHFFDRDTMRFFRSRVDVSTFTAPDGWYFVTSEQHKSAFARIDEPRLYTVRQLRVVTRDDGTLDVGLYELEGFQAFATLGRARTAARHAARVCRTLCDRCRFRLSIDPSQVTCQECLDYETRHQAAV